MAVVWTPIAESDLDDSQKTSESERLQVQNGGYRLKKASSLRIATIAGRFIANI